MQICKRVLPLYRQANKTTNQMKTRIEELKAKLANLNYNENGMPIGIEPSEYVAICEELESLEN